MDAPTEFPLRASHRRPPAFDPRGWPRRRRRLAATGGIVLVAFLLLAALVPVDRAFAPLPEPSIVSRISATTSALG